MIPGIAKAGLHAGMKPFHMMAGPKENAMYPYRVGAATMPYAAAGLVLLSVFDGGSPVSIEGHETVHASQRAELTLAETIPQNTCGIKLEADFKNASAELAYKVHIKTKNTPIIGSIPGVNKLDVTTPSIATWKRTWSGKIGAEACTKNSTLETLTWDPTAPRRDCSPTAIPKVDANGKITTVETSQKTDKAQACRTGAYVLKIDMMKDMNLIMYPVEPGQGFEGTNSPGAAIVGNLLNTINASYIFQAHWLDHKMNGLDQSIMAMVMDEMATTCAPQGIELLAHPKNVTADANLAQPKSLQGNTIRGLMLQGNAMMYSNYLRQYGKEFMDSAEGQAFWAKEKLTPDDFNVTVTAPNPTQRQAMLSNYTAPGQALRAKSKAANLSLPKRSSYKSCVNTTGQTAVRSN